MYGYIGLAAGGAILAVLWQLEIASHTVTKAENEILQRNQAVQEAAINSQNDTIIKQNANMAAMLTTNNFLRDQRAEDRKGYDKALAGLNSWKRKLRDAVLESPGKVAAAAGERIVERMRDIGALSQRARDSDSREGYRSRDIPPATSPGDTTAPN
jgi:hypothetical protein